MIAPPVLFVAIAAVFLFGVNRDNPDALQSAFIGREAPTLDLPPLAGLQPVTPDFLKGDGVKLVNFWASWCGPCRIEHPTLEGLADEGMPIVGINYKDDPERAKAFLTELGNPYVAVGTDPQGRAAFDWGVSAVPETFVVDSEGIVRLRFAGPVTPEILRKIVRPAIEKAE